MMSYKTKLLLNASRTLVDLAMRVSKDLHDKNSYLEKERYNERKYNIRNTR